MHLLVSFNFFSSSRAGEESRPIGPMIFYMRFHVGGAGCQEGPASGLKLAASQ